MEKWLKGIKKGVKLCDYTQFYPIKVVKHHRFGVKDGT